MSEQISQVILQGRSKNMDERKLAWMQHQLPAADFTKWSIKEVAAFKDIVTRHCCSVCGRWDEGCLDGC